MTCDNVGVFKQVSWFFLERVGTTRVLTHSVDSETHTPALNNATLTTALAPECEASALCSRVCESLRDARATGRATHALARVWRGVKILTAHVNPGWRDADGATARSALAWLCVILI